MSPDLAQLLKYKNPDLVSYFCHHHPEYTQEQVQVLFADLLQWLWLNNKRKYEGKTTYMFEPLLVLDELWHAFILHTRDYFDFCMRYFGEYIHHDMEPVGFEHHLNEEELRDFLEDCFSYLNQEWVERYFKFEL